MTKCHKLCIMLILVLLISIGSNITKSTVTYAAVSENNPLVYIAIDVTNQTGENCVETFHTNINTPQDTITRVKCPAGTLTHIALIPRAEAIAMHRAYVISPNKEVSQAEQRQMLQQIKHLSVQPSSSSPTTIHPTVSCGSQGTASLTWESYFSTVQYYKSIDCNNVTFEQASVQNAAEGASYWEYDLYAGHQYNVPGCPYVSNGYYWHGVNQTTAAGYYYENWFRAFFPCTGFEDYNNIGPIN